MAKKTNNDLLSEILIDLDYILKSQKDLKNKADKQDGVLSKMLNGPSTPDSKNTNNDMAALNTLKLIMDSVSGAKKIKDSDVDHVKNIVTSITSILKDIKFNEKDVKSFNQFAVTLKQLDDMMKGLNDNLIKALWTLWKFNPIRGKVLGESVAGFYRAFFEEFEKAQIFSKLSKQSKKSVDNFLAINKVILQLFQLNAKSVKQLGKAFEKMDAQAMSNISGFFSSLVDVVKKYPKGEKEFKQQIKNFNMLMMAMSSIPFIQLWIMSKILSEKQAKTIATYFDTLIKGFNKIGQKNVDSASKIVKSIAFLLLALTASLLICIIIATKFKISEIIGGFLIMGSLVLLSMGIIQMLSKISFKEEKGKVNIKDGLYTVLAITVLLLSLTLLLDLSIKIGKKYKFMEVMAGIGIMSVLILFAIGLTYLLSLKKIQDNSKNALWTIVAMALIVLVMVEMALVFRWAAKSSGDIFEGSIVMMGITVAMIGIIWLAGKLPKSDVVKGLITIGAICLSLVLLTFAVSYYMDLMDRIKSTSLKDILSGSAIVLAIIVGTAAIVFAASACITGPQGLFFAAGLAAIAGISGVILLISDAISEFVKMLKMVSKLSKEQIKHACDILVGDDNSVTWCLTTIVKEMVSQIGFRAAMLMSFMGVTMRPFIGMLGKFIDIIVQMASLKYVESYDEKGNPRYAKMPNDVFIKASETLAKGFGQFVKILGDTFKDDSKPIQIVQQICEQLCPQPPKRSLTGMLFGRSQKVKASVGDLINVLSNFVDIIQKMAVMRYLVGFDKDGNPTYDKMPDGAFEKAAKTLARGFADFLKVLGKDGLLSRETIANVRDLCDQLMPQPKRRSLGGWLFGGSETVHATVGDLINILSNFVDIIQKMYEMKYVEDYVDGNPVYKPMTLEQYKTAADNLSKGFSMFLESLASGFIEDPKIIKTVQGICDQLMPKPGNRSFFGKIFGGEQEVHATVGDLLQVLGMFVEIVQSMSDLKFIERYDGDKPVYKKGDMSLFDTAATTLINGFNAFLNGVSTGFGGISRRAQDAIDNIVNGPFNSLIDCITKLFETIEKAESLKLPQYDNQGRIIGYKKMNIQQSASSLANAIAGFVTTIINSLKPAANGSEDVIALISGTGKYKNCGIIDIIKNTEKILVPLNNFSTGKGGFFGKENVSIERIKVAAKDLHEIFSLFGQSLSIIKKIELTGINENINNIGIAINSVFEMMKPYINIAARQMVGSFSNSINTISSSISNLISSIRESQTIDTGVLLQNINPELVNKVVVVLNQEAEAFNTIEESIKKANDQMQKLVNLTREYTMLTNQSAYGLFAESINQKTLELRNAVNNLTNTIDPSTNSILSVRVVNSDIIKEGIEQSSISYKQLRAGNDITYVKA